MSDTLFAIIHLSALLVILGYGIWSLVAGNSTRGLILILLLVVYYFLVLHKAVLKEIARRRKK
jgi:hypothetical protein